MTNATMKHEFNPGRSPLLGLAAVVAAALTLGTAVLLPARHAPVAPVGAVPRVEAPAPVQVVNLPAVEVVGTRPTKAAENAKWTVPAALKGKG
jgi:hypothetical protein